MDEMKKNEQQIASVNADELIDDALDDVAGGIWPPRHPERESNIVTPSLPNASSVEMPPHR